MFVSPVSGLFLKLIYHRAGTVVHLLLLKFSMSVLFVNSIGLRNQYFKTKPGLYKIKLICKSCANK